MKKITKKDFKRFMDHAFTLELTRDGQPVRMTLAQVRNVIESVGLKFQTPKGEVVEVKGKGWL